MDERGFGAEGAFGPGQLVRGGAGEVGCEEGGYVGGRGGFAPEGAGLVGWDWEGIGRVGEGSAEGGGAGVAEAEVWVVVPGCFAAGGGLAVGDGESLGAGRRRGRQIRGGCELVLGGGGVDAVVGGCDRGDWDAVRGGVGVAVGKEGRIVDGG